MADAVKEFFEAPDWPSAFRVVHQRKSEFFEDAAAETMFSYKERMGKGPIGGQLFNLYLEVIQTGASRGVRPMVDLLETIGFMPKLVERDVDLVASAINIQAARLLWEERPELVTALLANRIVVGEAFWLLLIASVKKASVSDAGDPSAGTAKPTLIVDDHGTVRRVMKIIPLSDGGLAVTAPYHKARAGVLFKMPGRMPPGSSYLDSGELVPFSASNRVKLSYHVDGFAQFSGEDNALIISGRDQDTGEPRGLGLIARPLDDPIMSGPSIVCSLWGVCEFEEWRPRGRDVPIQFKDDEYYTEPPDEGAVENGYTLSIFLVPTRLLAEAIGEFGTGTAIDIRLPMSIYHRRRDFRAKVVCLKGPATALVIAMRDAFGFPDPSGFQLSGPGDGDKALIALYPGPKPDDEATSLDRVN